METLPLGGSLDDEASSARCLGHPGVVRDEGVEVRAQGECGREMDRIERTQRRRFDYARGPEDRVINFDQMEGG